MISSPSGSPKTLVFLLQISSPNSKGFPQMGASKKGHHHHHHRDAKRLAGASRRCDPPLAAGPRSLLHPCRSRSGGSRWLTVGHRRVSNPVKAAHHPSTWCRFVGSGLLVHRPPKANLPRPRRGGRATVGFSNWQR